MLEAQIIDRADEIAYINHDLDDGLRSGYINLASLIAEVELFAGLWRGVADDYPSWTRREKSPNWCAA